MGLMRTLDEIAIAFGTDKATQFTRTYARAKGLTVHYAEVFEPLRNLPVKLLEIGAAGGESIQTWLEYFYLGQIRGIDIVEKTNPWNTPGESPDPRYQFLQGNQGDPVMWQCAVANWGSDFDIIIDDGSHFSGDIITTFECLWPVLKSGGFYCVEDLGVDVDGSIFFTPGFPRHLDWIKTLQQKMNAGQIDISTLQFSRELLILKKG